LSRRFVARSTLFGFAAIASTHPEAICQKCSCCARRRRLHEQILTFDAHADIEIPGKPSMYVGADGLSKVAVDKMHQGCLEVVAMAVAVGPLPTKRKRVR
jgi:hypothetical protein